MYLPRGKLLALIAVVVAASMVTATGAFSSVKADRSANIEVAGDKNAYLAIQPSNDSNGAYAEIDNGMFKLDIGNIKNGGQGLNKNAVTSMHNVIAITNKGTQPVTVTVDEKNDKDAVTFYAGSNPSNPVEDDGIRISDGGTKKIGVKINTKNGSTATKLDTIVITAKSDNAGSAGSSNGGGNGGDSGNNKKSKK